MNDLNFTNISDFKTHQSDALQPEYLDVLNNPSCNSAQQIIPPHPHISNYYKIKWYVDVIIIVLTLWFIVPITLISMLLVRLTSRGPIFYTQIRCGLNGKPFKMIKIRSMIVDAEQGGKPKWSNGNDPRITTIGRIMRKLHIDEFPQIINVLRGEMTVIGPRPERPEFVEKLKLKIPGYEYRMCVLPGMTGYAQVNWKADNGIEDVQRKLILDLEYIEDVTPWFDFRILLATINFPRKLCGIHQTAENSRWSSVINLHNEHESVVLSSSHNVK
ncbi:MAG: sugar transferase [Planctomycetaceae bacterium]|jgi:lipopolysaccharide/colanic/teichoic acid biosynthesis glycosyltransferase|nr:sugar transferase [Planctomycetaceae bacterium]